MTRFDEPTERDEIHLEISAEAAGERVDRHLADRLEVSRNRVQKWIREERVTVGGEPTKSSATLAGGEIVVCRPPTKPHPDRLEPQSGPLAVLHADEHLVVVDKSAGVAMHPGAGRPDGTLVNFLLARYPEIATVGSPRRPGIVHRLDLDTTGAVVVARTDVAYRRLSRAFAERRVHKVYLAVCYGEPAPASGRFERPIGRHPQRRTEMAVRPDGRAARTEYDVLATRGGVSLLRLVLATGRTHQIRVHLKTAGHPLVGDPTYGEARWKNLPARLGTPLRSFTRSALHAWRLAFDHPATGRRVTFESPPPDDLRELWRALADAELPTGR